MTPSYRVSRYFLTALLAGGLFLLIHTNQLAQSSQLPAPKTHINDLAGVVDAQTRTRLEGVLDRLKEKSKIELYVAVVDTTDGIEVADYSQRLAREWNIGSKSSRGKSLLLVISAASRTSFTQYTRTALAELPEGLLGDVSYRMNGPLSKGHFTEAVEVGVYTFVNTVAAQLGFNPSELERPAITAEGSTQVAVDGAQPVLVSATNASKTRPRTVKAAADPAATPPAPLESATPEPAPTEPTKTEVTTEPAKTEPAKTTKIPTSKTPAKATPTPRRVSAAEQAEIDADESEEVELTLTLPLAKRAVALKEWLETHPYSKSRARAQELLISTHAGLGDQALKAGDSAGGIQQLMQAIDQADLTISDQLFTGVIAQIPMNLYVRGEKNAAFQAAQSVEAKFGKDAKRLLTIAGFYLNVERGSEVVRVSEEAVKLAPDMAEAHRLLAVGYHISLRLDEAAAEYKLAIEIDPNSKVSRGSLADLYRASGKTEEALALYNEQLAADPKDRAARAGKVISLFELKRQDEANRELEAALAEEPRNLPLLAGAAYWFAAHENNEKALELARKAVAIEPRYTWAQIAFARALVAMKRPLDAERSMRYARQYGKFPTLNYELANVLSSMGLYDEATEVLRESFSIKGDQIHTYLAGHLPASDAGFPELLAPERRASIYQKTSADTAANAKTMKALLALNAAISAEKIDESAAVAAAREFASGNDGMRAFRQIYAASRLLRQGVGLSAVLELTEQARKATDDALNVQSLTMAVQADEFRELRARAIASGKVPDVAEAPQSILTRILKGRIEDLTGWALFNQAKYSEATHHLKIAADTLPGGTPSWRTALWHLGAALEQSDQKQALDYYIKSYNAGEPDPVRRSVIEQLYRKVNGSLDGLDQLITAGGVSTATTTTEPAPADAPAGAAAGAAATPTAEATPTPEPSPAASLSSATTKPMSEEEALKLASRTRSTVKITGRVLDANKVGLANVTIVLISPTGMVLTATTDNEGSYSFTVAAPSSQKTYRLIPSRDGFSFAPIDKAFVGLIEDQKDIDFIAARQ